MSCKDINKLKTSQESVKHRAAGRNLIKTILQCKMFFSKIQQEERKNASLISVRVKLLRTLIDREVPNS